MVTCTMAARLTRTETVARRVPWLFFARADSAVTAGSGQPLAVFAYSSRHASEASEMPSLSLSAGVAGGFTTTGHPLDVNAFTRGHTSGPAGASTRKSLSSSLSHASPIASPSRLAWLAFAVAGQLSIPFQSPSLSGSGHPRKVPAVVG